MSKKDVVIVGAGVAGLETLIALRKLAGDRANITILSPEEEFVDRPMLVMEPFEPGRAGRYPIERVAADFDATFMRTAAVALDADSRRVVCRDDESVTGDYIVLAPGARTRPLFPEAITFPRSGSSEAIRELLSAIEAGRARRVAFVAPSLAGWSLPLYELALMTAHHLAARGVDGAELTLVTPESRPLSIFGTEPSELVLRLLETAGIELVSSTYAEVGEGTLSFGIGRPAMPVDAVIALPLVLGAQIEGVPMRPPYGFIPVDLYGRVRGLQGVYAAGDAADVHIKQGGLAAQQADAVASHIAAELGAPVEPHPFRPVLRGKLLTGGDERFLRTRDGEDRAAWHALWWPPTKVAGRHLAPYLFAQGAIDDPGPPPTPFMDLEQSLAGATLPG